MAELRIALLGPPRVERDGAPIEVDTRKAIAMLAYLAIHPERHGRDAVAGLLWPDYDTEHARGALRRTLSTLNKAVGPGWLAADRTTVGFAQAGFWLDVTRFEELVAGCRDHGHPPDDACPACLAPLAEAARLHRGDFLAGFSLRDSTSFDDWQYFQAERLRRELAGTLERLAAAQIGQRRWDDAVDAARRWLALDPLHEPAHRQLMRIYSWSGRRGAALRQFQACQRVLEEELGVEPLEETVAVHEAVQANRLPPPPEPAAAPAAPVDGRGQPASGAATLPLRGAEPGAGSLEAARGGSVGVAPVGAGRGPAGRAGPGMGGAAGRLPGCGRRRAAGGDRGRGRHRQDPAGRRAGRPRPLPWRLGGQRPLLRGGGRGRLRPVHRGPAGRPGRGGSGGSCSRRRQRPDGVGGPGAGGWTGCRGTGWPRPGGCCPSWSRPIRDCPSRGRWTARPPAASSSRGSARSCWPPAPAPCRGCWSWTTCTGPTRRPWTCWPTWSTGSRAVPCWWWPAGGPSRSRPAPACAGSPPRPGGPGRAASWSCGGWTPPAWPSWSPPWPRPGPGRPGCCTSGPRACRSWCSSTWPPSARTASCRPSLPGGARDLLEARVRGIGDAARQLLGTAAVLGRSFDVDTARAASGRSDEEAVAALEELAARGLVHEVAGDVYDFGHGLVRDLVYEQTSLARRRLLHRRVGEALAAGARGRRPQEPPAASIARHLELGGAAAEAAGYHRLAGDQARAVFANREALDHYRAAVALGHPDAAGLHAAIGDLETLLGNYDAALAAYTAAAGAATDDERWVIEQRLGAVCARRGDWDAAERHLTAALAALGSGGPEGRRAGLAADRSLAAHRQGRNDAAQQLANDALDLAGESGDPDALARAHGMLGMLSAARGDHDTARRHLEQSLTLAEALPDPSARVAALNNLALAHRATGEVDLAVDHTRTALELCTRQGDRHREAALHNNLADLLHLAGHHTEAMDHLKQAVAIFAEVGEPGPPNPEIWKLVSWPA